VVRSVDAHKASRWRQGPRRPTLRPGKRLGALPQPHQAVPRQRQLPAITRFTVETWHADLAAGGRNPATIRKAHTLLQTALARAVDDDRINKNPAAQTAPVKGERAKWQLVTHAEFVALLTEIPKEYQALVLLAPYTGLRWSEIVALRRADYNPLHAELTVSKGTVYHAGRLIDDKTKSGQERVIPGLADDLVGALNAHIARQQMGPAERLFTSPEGHTLRHPHFMERVFKPAAVRCGLGKYVQREGQRHYEGVRFHDLRHSFVSWLLADGTPIHIAQQLAGHSSITTTQQYAQTNRDELRKAMRRALG
jgi:integrase